jgi:hypothetical protein
LLQPEQHPASELDSPVRLKVEWWADGDDYAVRITDHTTGTCGQAVREVFAEAVGDAYLQVIGA